MKDRYFKYLAAAIVAGVVLAIFNPGHPQESAQDPVAPAGDAATP